MEILLHHLMESFSRLLLTWVTPPVRVSYVQRRFGDQTTVIRNEPVEPYNVWPRRRGPDDYTPVNLRHDLDAEYIVVDVDSKNK